VIVPDTTPCRSRSYLADYRKLTQIFVKGIDEATIPVVGNGLIVNAKLTSARSG
jgi:hypothetical protein